jgi:NitT/TauT family transport system permease protein
MFAALFLVSLAGIAIFLFTTWLSNLLLSKWHESAVKREN